MADKDPFYFTHTVLFWMNDPNNEGNRRNLKDGLLNLIANSKHAKFGHVGTPAGTDRPVVDNTYDFSLMVTFESAGAQDKYQVEPAHKSFIEECQHTWSRVQIFDSISVVK